MSILIPDAVFPDAHDEERRLAAPHDLVLCRETDPEAIAPEVWADARAIVGYHRMTFDAAVAAKARSAEILVRAGAGYDNVDLAAWASRGMTVCRLPHYGAGEVADHAIGMLLALARGFPHHAQTLQDPEKAPGSWSPLPIPPTVRRLAGSRILIVGLGAIGSRVASRARALDLDVAFFSPSAGPGIDKALGAVREDDLDVALGRAEIVSLHCPLTSKTRGIINERTLTLLPRGSLLINTARGELMDLAAVEQALRDGRLGGLGIDVYPDEPPGPGTPLLSSLRSGDRELAGKVVATPHSAWSSPAAMRAMRLGAIEIARDFLETGAARHAIAVPDPDRVSGRTDPASADQAFR